MKKTRIGGIALLLLMGWLPAQQIEDLANRAADYIRNFFKEQHAVTAAVVSLENRSSLPTSAVERTYQLIYSKLSEFNENQFLDLLTEFSKERARFNLSKAHQLHYFIDLKFIQRSDKVGLGIAIFSRRMDRLVGISYLEAGVTEGEKNLFHVKEFDFKSLGFAKTAEVETKRDLMDIASAEINGIPQLFFFYPDQIVICKWKENGLEKISEIKMQWSLPYYPVLHSEGKLRLFLRGKIWMMTAGTNFSPKGKIFALEAGATWRENDSLPFVPFGQALLNGNEFLIGGMYETGKNYFQERLFFLPIDDAGVDASRLYEKKVPAFYSLDFSSVAQGLALAHMIDTSYTYSVFPADFTAPILQMPQKGSCLAVLDNRWLAVSDYTRGSDRLFFLSIENGSSRLVYENPVFGEILFIAAGQWRSRKGFWVYSERNESSAPRFSCEFWSKENE